MKRKGQLTIPNIAGVAVLLFIFAVVGDAMIFPIINNAVSKLMAAGGQGELLTAVVLLVLPTAILLSILTAIFKLQAVIYEDRERQKMQQRGGRR